MLNLQIKLNLTLKSDKPPLTEFNNTANCVVGAIDDIGQIIANTFEPKLFITVEHVKNHQAYNYIYTVRILDDAQDKKMYEERYVIIEKLLESIKIISEKPLYEDLCKDWIARLRTLLINSNYCEDEEGIQEISSILEKLQKKLSKMYSKLKIEMLFNYLNKGSIPNRITDDNIGLFNRPNVTSENENAHQSDNVSETQKSPNESLDNDKDKDKDDNSGIQAEQTTFKDSVVVEFVAKLRNSGQIYFVPHIKGVSVNLCYSPMQGEQLCDEINSQKIKKKLLIDTRTNLNGANKVLKIFDGQM
jgi:hypothetical protein